MFDAYRIGVTVALHNAAGKGLRSISQEMQAAHRETLALQKDVQKLERLSGPDSVLARREKASLAAAKAAASQTSAIGATARANAEQQARVQQNLTRAEREYAARRTERLNRLSELGSTRKLLLDQQAASEQDAFRKFASLRQKADALDVATEAKLADRQARMVQLRRRGAILEGGIEVQREQTRKRLSDLAERRRFYEERIAWRQGKGRGTSFLEGRLASLNRDTALVQAKADLAEKRHSKSWEKNQRDQSVTSAEIDELPRKREIEAAKIRAEQEALHNRHLLASESLTKRVRGLDSEGAKIQTKLQNAEATHLENTANLRAKAVRLAEDELSIGQRLAASEERRKAATERAADANRRRAEAKERHEKRSEEFAKKRAERDALQQRQQFIGGLKTAGVGMMAFGGGLAWMLSKTYGPAKELQKARSELQSAGIGPQWRNRVEHAAVRMGNRIPTSDTASSMRAFLDLRQVFGVEQMALDALPNMLKASAILGVMTRRKVSVGDLAQEMSMAMGRALDQRGATRDPKSFFKEANEMARVMIWSGGQITPTTYQGAFKYMRGAKYTPNDEFMYRYFPSWIAATKSNSGSGAHGGAATGFATLTKNVMLGYGMTKDQVALGVQLGLIDPKNVTAKGKMKPNTGFVGTELGDTSPSAFANNPFLYMRDRMLPGIIAYLKRQGKETEGEAGLNNISMVANQLIRTGAAQDVLVAGLRNVVQIERDAKMIGRAKDTSAYRTMLRNNPEMAEMALGATWESFKQEVGDSLIPFVLEYLPRITKGIRNLTQWMDDNPALTRSMVKMTAYVSGLSMLGGVAALATAGIMGLGKPLSLVKRLFLGAGKGAHRGAFGLRVLNKVLSLPVWLRTPMIAAGLWEFFKVLDKFDKFATKYFGGQAPGVSMMGRTDPSKPIEEQFADWARNPTQATSVIRKALGFDTGTDPIGEHLFPQSPLNKPEPLLSADAVKNAMRGGSGGDLYISLEMDGRPISNYVMKDFEDRVDRQATSATRFDGRRNRTVQGARNRR